MSKWNPRSRPMLQKPQRRGCSPADSHKTLGTGLHTKCHTELQVHFCDKRRTFLRKVQLNNPVEFRSRLPSLRPHSHLSAGRCLRLLDCGFFFAPLPAPLVEASVQKALPRLMLEVFSGAHQGRIVDQGVEELPVPAGSLDTGHSVFLLLLDKLDPCGHSDVTSASPVCTNPALTRTVTRIDPL